MNSRSGLGERSTSTADLKKQVQEQLNKQLGEESISHEYEQFRRDNLPRHHSFYERLAKRAGSVLRLSSSPDPKLQADLEAGHLDCTVEDVKALTLIGPLIVLIAALFFTVMIPVALGATASMFYLVFSVILAGMSYLPLRQTPSYLATRWRQQSSNQMVLAIFYIVTYMRHTPNLELAVEFAADHIGPPLSLDLIKVLWDVETEKHQTVSESLEAYLRSWREDAREFIESVHLIEASLYEASNDRRLSSLDKALDVMLEETYEKMLHYAQDLKGPMTMLHMLGIILPILGLVILPLAVSFFDTHWTIIFSLYNIILPFFVYYLGRRVLATRPSGYGQGEISQIGIALEQREASRGARVTALLIASILFVIGISPLVIHAVAPDFDVAIGPFSLIGYIPTDTGERGPYGLGAGLLSVFVTLAAGLGLGYYYRKKVGSLIKVRQRSRKLEDEFASALFQLGNRIGEGIPAEIAFGRVAQMMEGTMAGDFFRTVALNIQQLGMGVEDAIFDTSRGALLSYPSDLIESSMKVLLESSHKGPEEASRALISMSTYIREMHRVDERLKDLLSDVISSMKSQISFLLPVIAGIVIGITSMITTVLGAVKREADAFASSGAGTGGSLPLDLFGLGIPSFYFQIIIGLYVVQVTWILSYLISGIENGVDPLSEDYLKGRSLVFSTLLYCAIALAVMLCFNLLAGEIISTTNTSF